MTMMVKIIILIQKSFGIEALNDSLALQTTNIDKYMIIQFWKVANRNVSFVSCQKLLKTRKTTEKELGPTRLFMIDNI